VKNIGYAMSVLWGGIRTRGEEMESRRKAERNNPCEDCEPYFGRMCDDCNEKNGRKYRNVKDYSISDGGSSFGVDGG